MSGIRSLGWAALAELVKSNRSAHNKYVSNVRSWVAAKIDPLERYATVPDGRRSNALKSDAQSAFREIEDAISQRLSYDFYAFGDQYYFSHNHTRKYQNEFLYLIAATDDG